MPAGFGLGYSSADIATRQAARGGGTPTPTPATAEITLAIGDSTNVFGSSGGTPQARTGGTDLAWPGCRNHRWRSGQSGFSTALPYDQAVSPTGVNYLSTTEYEQKRAYELSGLNQYVIPHGNPGSAIMGAGSWNPSGGADYLSAIDRCNGANTWAGNGGVAQAIAAEAAAGGRAVFSRVIVYLTTNDMLQSGYTQAGVYARLSALVTGLRAGIYANGVSGGAIGNVPFVFVMPVQEGVANTSHSPYSGVACAMALRQLVKDLPAIFLFTYAEGSGDSDKLHAVPAAQRTEGPKIAELRYNATVPVITTAGAFSCNSGSTMAQELTASGIAIAQWWLTGTDAAKMEIALRQEATDGSLPTGRYHFDYRWAANGTKDYSAPDDANADNVYQVTLNTIGLNGVPAAPKALAITIPPPYGVGDQGAVTSSYAGIVDGDDYQYGTFDIGTKISIVAGLNIFSAEPRQGNGVPTAVYVNGAPASRFTNYGISGDVWGFVSAVADPAATISFNTGNSQFNKPIIQRIGFTGTKATPLDTDLKPYAGSYGPTFSNTSKTVPTGGIYVDFGFWDPSGGTVDSAGGTSNLGATSYMFADKRTTSGALTRTGPGVNYGRLISLLFEKSA